MRQIIIARRTLEASLRASVELRPYSYKSGPKVAPRVTYSSSGQQQQQQQTAGSSSSNNTNGAISNDLVPQPLLSPNNSLLASLPSMSISPRDGWLLQAAASNCTALARSPHDLSQGRVLEMRVRAACKRKKPGSATPVTKSAAPAATRRTSS